MFFVIVLILSLLSPLYFIYKPPSLLITLLSYHWPDVLFRVSTSSNLIALTIDDAPSEYTRDILALLERYDAHATFFVIGSQAKENDEQAVAVLADMVRAGHELGNHGMRDEPARSLAPEELRHQILAVERTITAAYGAAGELVGERTRQAHGGGSLAGDEGEGSHEVEIEGAGVADGRGVGKGVPRSPPKFYRPGSGFFSTRMRQMAKDMGYRIILGSVYPHDPQIKHWKLNAWNILSGLGTGKIVICHDRRSWTVPMLERVLKVGTGKGWRFVSVGELLGEAEEGG